MNTYRITDDNGILWESSDFDAKEVGAAIMQAVEDGDYDGYKDEIGPDWQGDLVFAHIIRTAR